MGNFCEFKKVENMYCEDATLVHKDNDFKLGFGENVELNGSGELVLRENEIEGTYISPEIRTYGFRDLVSSWNAKTPKGTNIEVFFQVVVEGKWSKWFSYGKWASNGPRGSISGQIDEIARMDIDTLVILDGKQSEGFRYKITMLRNNPNIESFKVKAISATLRLFESKPKYLDENKNWIIDLNVPERSQMVIPQIGNIICSPTSVSMVMEYYGQKIDTEEVAASVLDNGANIYGNWSFNVAYAGSKGLSAYVARFVSANEIKEKIAEGIPVIASIRIKTKEELTGAPSAYPGGHLLVVRGFTIKDGEEHVIVNDPAAPNHDTVRREYKLSEFEKAWGKIVYILTPDSK